MTLKVCSLCGKEKSISDFNKNKKKSDGLQTQCRSCGKEKSKSYYKANVEKHKTVILKRKKKVIKQTAQYVWNYLKQNPCVDCGEKDPIVLDLDHVRGKKKRAVSHLVRRGNCLETIKKEIDKCEVRCSNCHRLKTAKDFQWYKNIDMGF